MQSIRLMFFSLIALTFASPVVAEDVEPERREALETAIPEGIRLLEAKEYEAFVKTFVPPANLKEITEGTSLQEFAKMVGERKAPRLLVAFKEIKNAKPELDDTATKATFVFAEKIGAKKSITFVKIEKYWYLKN